MLRLYIIISNLKYKHLVWALDICTHTTHQQISIASIQMSDGKSH